MNTTKELMKKFMLSFGPSGFESETASLFKKEMQNLADEITVDRFGNVMCKFDGTDKNAPKVMVFAHLDEIGLIVKKVEANGFLRMDRIGYIPEKVLPGLEITIQTDFSHFIPGVFGNKSQHSASTQDQNQVDKLGDLYVDIGASSAQEVYNLGIHVGSPATYKPNYIELVDNMISGTAIDNRGGVVALILAAQLIKQSSHASTIYLVGGVWEEFNVRGVALATKLIQPDVLISLDVCLCGDTPDMSKKFDTKCGLGPSLATLTFHGRGSLNGTIAHKGLADLAIKVAKEIDIPLQFFATTDMLTDAAFAQMEGFGLAAIELGFPTRYTHTPTEVTNVTDIENLAHLVACIATKIDADFDVNRYTI